MTQISSNVIELNPPANITSPVTPMMRQYLEIKQAHEEYLLFYRMGDFYELFFEDAVLAAKTLDIALTYRGKHLGQDIPMCGVPHHSAEYYLHKLIRNGYKVAICEQMEDPTEAKKRGAKSVIQRDVVRIVTQGTLTEETLLEARTANYLVAIAELKGEISIAYADISTGEVIVMMLTYDALATELARIVPSEIIIPEKIWQDKRFQGIVDEWRSILTPQANNIFDTKRGERALLEVYQVATLDGIGIMQPICLAACGALLDYIRITQIGALPRLHLPKYLNTSDYVAIDASTRRNLEMMRTMQGDIKGSLFYALDRTNSGAGARLLAQQLSAPLRSVELIQQRLDAIQFYLDYSLIREQMRIALQGLPDMERALARLALGRGGPRDVVAIREGLTIALQIAEYHSFIELLPNAMPMPSLTQQMVENLGNHDALLVMLRVALQAQVPMLARDGNFIQEGYHPKLDEYRNTQVHSQEMKEALRERYSAQTGISSLKIKENNVLGYFIEVTPQHANKIPEEFTHRQTMGGALRYTTQELKALEHAIVNARGFALELELQLFRDIVQQVLSHADALTHMAQALSQLDVSASLAYVAESEQYIRPILTTNAEFLIQGGRHPVVEQQQGEAFIKNDCNLCDHERLWLMTGPNMAGKSTFLRQNALIAIMAQMGSFIPADAATIGVVDKIFSRVGASDNLAKGQSTFMVEMVETAMIVNNATTKSLVILDEIGRGTATYDGLSIAWAVVEYLHDVIGCRALFATHYHELTTLSHRLHHLACHTMKVKEWQGNVVFLHEVMAGVANRSYGIHVGKLAGLPKSVLSRAEQVLGTLQQHETGSAMSKLSADLPLFSGLAENYDATIEVMPAQEMKPSLIETLINEKDLATVTPIDALNFLYQLQEKVREM